MAGAAMQEAKLELRSGAARRDICRDPASVSERPETA